MTPNPANAESLSRFPCKQCGAKLEFAPGTHVLICPYCGASNEIGSAGPLRATNDASVPPAQRDLPADKLELDYLNMLDELEHHADVFEHLVVKCDACGAEVEAPPSTTSFHCPFCGSNIVATAKAATHIKPNAVLPFKLTQDKAREMYRAWVKSRWFAPSRLKRESFIDASFTGVYVPSWTYDCAVTTRYTGERGDAHYVSVNRIVNGRSVSSRERRIRWSLASGTVSNIFDDVLVLASKSLNQEQLEEIDPWDTKLAIPYSDAYLAGFKAEVYQVSLAEGFETAKVKMRPRIESSIRNDIGGDEQRIGQTSSTYADITFKHLLLPVWLSAYRFNQKTYRFMVNARTGEVVGERPYSWIKITLFTIACVIVVLTIVLLLSQANR